MKATVRSLALVMCALAPVSACARSSAPSSPAPAVAGSGEQSSSAARRLPAGVWGGQGIALTVTAEGAELEFDCASGRIAEPVMVDAIGNLTVDGVFIPESGGPVRVDHVPDRQPARYTGRITGEILALDITLTSANTRLGPYSLRAGDDPRLRKCR